MAYYIVGAQLLAAGAPNLRNSLKKKRACSATAEAAIAEARRDTAQTTCSPGHPEEFMPGGKPGTEPASALFFLPGIGSLLLAVMR